MKRLSKNAEKLLKALWKEEKKGIEKSAIYEINEYASTVLTKEYKSYHGDYLELTKQGFIKLPEILEPQEEYDHEYAVEVHGIPKEESVITSDGNAYLHNLKISKIKFWFPIIISGCALIISVGAFVVSITA